PGAIWAGMTPRPAVGPTCIALVMLLGAVQVVLLSLRGQTVGKLALGIRIVDAKDGSNPGFFRAVLLRILVPTLIGTVPLLGRVSFWVAVLCLFGDDRRRTHDAPAGTKAVDVWAGPPPPRELLEVGDEQDFPAASPRANARGDAAGRSASPWPAGRSCRSCS